MKEGWYKQWLENAGYKFWYKERDNEVWKNDKFAVVWHEAVGMRIMVPLDFFSEGYLCKVFIPTLLAKQEE